MEQQLAHPHGCVLLVKKQAPSLPLCVSKSLTHAVLVKRSYAWHSVVYCRCAQCLGLLGAIDPAHVNPELPRPAPFAYDAKFCLVTLVQQHLVRVLQTACDIGQLEVTSYAIQQILQHYTKRQLAKAVRSTQVCYMLRFLWVKGRYLLYAVFMMRCLGGGVAVAW